MTSMKMEVTIDTHFDLGVHMVTLQSNLDGRWGGKTTLTLRDDPSVGNAVRQAVMDLIAVACVPDEDVDWQQRYGQKEQPQVAAYLGYANEEAK